MHTWTRIVAAVLAVTGAARPTQAEEAKVTFTLEQLGASPSGGAILLRERHHPAAGLACPANAYSKVKGRCNLGVTLHVCDVGEGQCDSVVVYGRLIVDLERTSEQKAAASLGEAKKKALALGIVLDENARVLGEVPDDLFSAEGLEGLSFDKAENEGSVDIWARAGGLALSIAYVGHPMEDVDDELSSFLTSDRSVIVLYRIDTDYRANSEVSVHRVRELAARFLQLRAHARYAKKDWAGAARDFAAAVERDPKLTTARLGLGLAQLRLGKRSEALAALQRAVATTEPPPGVLSPAREPSVVTTSSSSRRAPSPPS